MKSIQVLHTNEELDTLCIWAPRITYLNLSGRNIYRVVFPTEHALKRDLPNGFQFNEELVVDSTNAMLEGPAILSIMRHNRVYDASRQQLGGYRGGALFTTALMG